MTASPNTVHMTDAQFNQFLGQLGATPAQRGYGGRTVDYLVNTGETFAAEGGRIVNTAEKVVKTINSLMELDPRVGPDLRFSRDCRKAAFAATAARHQRELAEDRYKFEMEERSILAGAWAGIRGVDRYRSTRTGMTVKKALVYTAIFIGIVLVVGAITYLVKSRAGGNVVDISVVEGGSIADPVRAGY